jgi:hypothetical protein
LSLSQISRSYLIFLSKVIADCLSGSLITNNFSVCQQETFAVETFELTHSSHSQVKAEERKNLVEDSLAENYELLTFHSDGF